MPGLNDRLSTAWLWVRLIAIGSAFIFVTNSFFKRIFPHLQALFQAPPSRPIRGLVIDMSLLSDRSPSPPHPQPQSDFLTRLPYDVRRMIYDAILPASRHLWIRAVPVEKGRKGGVAAEHLFEHYPITLDSERALYHRNGDSGGCVSPSCRWFWQCVDHDKSQYLHRESVSLMLSCKRIYLDLLPLCTFSFNHISDLAAFSAIASTLRLPIRTLRFAPPLLPRCFSGEYTWSPPETEWEEAMAVFARTTRTQQHRAGGPPVPDEIQRDLIRRPLYRHCDKHRLEWRDEIARLNEAVGRMKGLVKLVITLDPVRSTWDRWERCGVESEEALLESLRAIVGVPVIVVEAWWKQIEVPADGGLDVPHPDTKCRITVRRLEGRQHSGEEAGWEGPLAQDLQMTMGL